MKRSYFLLYLILLLCLPSTLYGAVIYVDDVTDPNEDGSAAHPFDTIQEGIDLAVDGDTVLVLDGTYTGYGNRDINFHGKAITLTSENGPSLTIIDIQGSSSNIHRGFYFNNGETESSVIHGFTIQNGYRSSDYGGAIYANNASPTIENCIFTNNQARHGGAIYIRTNCRLILTDCTFDSNTAHTYRGGAIRCYENVNGTITNCTFSNNVSEREGGAIALNSSSIVLINTDFIQNQSNSRSAGAIELQNNSSASISYAVFNQNTANRYGGAILSSGGDLTLEHCQFTGNTVTNYAGGAVFIQTDCSLSVSDCTFTNNQANANRGGAFRISNNVTSTFTDCTFSGNSSDSSGGAIAQQSGTISLTNVSFDLNESLSQSGGAIELRSITDTVQITDCSFSNNTAQRYGGAVFADQTNLDITNTSFTYNTATTNNGGALLTQYDHTLNLTDCEFSHNQAGDRSGGIYCYNNISGAITNCTFTNNTSDDVGGAITFRSCSFYLTDNTFDNNESISNNGGAIYLYSSSTMNIFNNTFSNNTAYNYGGALFADNSQLTILNTLFEGNTASNREGGAFRGQSITGSMKNCNFINNSAPGISGTGRGGGMSFYNSDDYEVAYCIFWGNTGENAPDIYPTSGLYVYHCDVEHSYPGVGNLDVDPLFVTGPRGDYYLSQIAAGQSSDSPCLDAGYDSAQNVCNNDPSYPTCMDELTTRTDSVTDTGTVDMGIHYRPEPTATPTVTPTPLETYTPTVTPTSSTTPLPSSTPTPTVTPTGTDTPTPTLTPFPTATPTITPTLLPLSCEWTELTSGGDAPGNRHYHRLAYDSDRQVITLYGGNDNLTYNYELWEFDGSSWNEVIPMDSPPGRDRPGWVYIKSLQIFFMFGGWNVNSEYLSDGWFYDPASQTWMELEDDLGCFPEPRQGHGMVYDPNSNLIILFGGLGFETQYFDDTWIFDPTVDPTTECPWSDVSPTVSPEARAFHGMCFVDRLNLVVLFGGDSSSGRFEDTWYYYPDLNQWVEMTDLNHPEYLQDMGMSYDSRHNRVLLYGGNVPDTRGEKDERYSVDQTWMFNPNSAEWTQLSSSVYPPARGQTSMAFNELWTSFVLYGGRSDYQWETDTWQYRICFTPTPTPTPKPLPSTREGGKFILILLFSVLFLAGTIRKLH